MRTLSDEKIITKRLKVYGIVQGVGFRPSVARHAAQAGITGYVCNKGPYVEIIAQGKPVDIETFAGLLEHKAPRRSVILKIDSAERPSDTRYESFEIAESEKTTGEIFIPPDIAICEDCARELFDPGDRRYLHPFINCTSCGPRLTILDALPYDRERTSMKMFPMCRKCADEYYSPGNRRYDAQPVCCHDCGPRVYLLTGSEEPAAWDKDAIREARKVIRGGGIVAVKGIGGFHLCCDAGNAEAVRLLRERKRRPRKPFAVMMREVDTVRQCCEISEAQEEILTGHQKPILLLKKRGDGRGEGILCEEIAPGNPTVGVMLPYAPVQLLLFGSEIEPGNDMPGALVMTSGNISGAPICRGDSEALSQLGSFCDCILSHDRRIRIRADDSVMDFYKGEPYMIRRSRGYAPLPFMLSEPDTCPPVIAVGGELKNTFCIGTNALYYPSSYIGDLADPRSVEVLRETADRYSSLLEVTPEAVACDLHPGYHSTEFAQELTDRLSEAAGHRIPLIRVQHHYAHILSCMAENDCGGRVIGVAMDGTGYGTDGTIWGGEILLSDRAGFTRSASICPFPQAGGDAASREGWRIAAGMLYRLFGDKERTKQTAPALGISSVQETAAVMAMIDHGINAVTSTSAGRLFDAVSCILGICRASSFEGEASMDLEFAAERFEGDPRHGKEIPPDLMPVKREGRWIMPTDRIVEEMVSCALQLRGAAGEGGQEAPASSADPVSRAAAVSSVEEAAYRFHRMLADTVIGCVMQIADEAGVRAAALSGGCFQNRLLLEMIEEGLTDRGIVVYRHRMVPPNDGGIALGQAVAAAAILRAEAADNASGNAADNAAGK